MPSERQEPGQGHAKASPPPPTNTTTTTTWVEDEKSWNEYQGVSVVGRMEKIKATLKEGLVRAQAEADVQEATSTTTAAATVVDSKVMAETVQSLQEILPADLRASLPWSALVNLMNTGLARVGWSFLGPLRGEKKEGGKKGGKEGGKEGGKKEAAAAATGEERQVSSEDCGKEGEAPLPTPTATAAAERLMALKDALHGVMHWLPDAALDHAATPTVDPASLGLEKGWAEYQVCD